MGSCCSTAESAEQTVTYTRHNGNGDVAVPANPEDVIITNPLPNPHPHPSYNIIKRVRAMYDYEKRTLEDLSFRRNDILEVIEIERDNPEWWKARNVRTNCTGFIPSNYVTEDDDNRLESQDWYFDVERRDAERYLLWVGNKTGTFLVRKSTDVRSIALSVKDFNPETNESCIKHYKIRRMDNGGVFIAARRPFATMRDLIRHYSEQADGLCCRLDVPCPKVPATVPFKKLEVRRSQVKTFRDIGHGNFGEVMQGKFQNSVDVAVKSLKPGTMPPEAFLAEAQKMHRFRHPKLVQLMGVCTEREPILIITELMVHGSLLDYLREKKCLREFPFRKLIDICAQVAEGMKYLEAQNFIHRDLRAANILVGENNEVKVADFGLAKVINEKSDTESDEPMKFPIKWTAPEAAYERKFSTKSDVWSYGVLLYEIVTFGRVPYPSLTGQEVLKKLSRENYRMEQPVSKTGAFTCPDPVYELMMKCWHRDPEKRPTFEYLYSFFDDFSIVTESSYREAP